MDNRRDGGNSSSQSNVFPSRVFKYVPPERIDVLENLTIRFTQPSSPALNDLFELKPIFDRIMPEGMLEKELDPSSDRFKSEELIPALEREYKKQSRKFRRKMTLDEFMAQAKQKIENSPDILDNTITELLPFFHSGLKMMVPAVKSAIENVVTKIGILSISSSATNPVLWGHYAANSKGLVYEFDTSHEFFDRRRTSEDELFHLRKVRYQNRESINRSCYEIDGNDLLCTKEERWAYEDEWRILALLDHAKTRMSINEDDVYLFELPATALTRVILGAKADSNLITRIEGLIKSRQHLSHIKTAQIRLNLESNSLDVLPLN